MALGNLFYRVFFKSTPFYVAYVVAGAIAFEYAVDTGINKVWDKNNQGVCATKFIVNVL
jgi:hypothetical protein